MTILIQQAQELADFAVKMQTLIELLSDKKSVKALITGIAEADAIISQKEGAQKVIKTANEVSVKLELKEKALADKEVDIVNKLANATAINNEAEAIKTKIVKDNDLVIKQLTEANKAKTRAETALKKAEDREIIADLKIAEAEKLKSDLELLKANYQDAISKLTSVKVA